MIYIHIYVNTFLNKALLIWQSNYFFQLTKSDGKKMCSENKMRELFVFFLWFWVNWNMPSALLSLFPYITTSFPLSQLCVISVVGSARSTIWKKKKKKNFKMKGICRREGTPSKLQLIVSLHWKNFNFGEIKPLQKPKFISYFEAFIVKVKYHEWVQINKYTSFL